MKFRQSNEKYGSRWTGSTQWVGRKRGFQVTIIHSTKKEPSPYFWFSIEGPAGKHLNSLWEDSGLDNNGRYPTFDEASQAAEAWIDAQGDVELLTAYWVNFDGRRTRLVATKSRAEAARLCEVTSNHMKDYGGSYSPEHDSGKIAYENPGTVYESRMNTTENWTIVSTPESRRQKEIAVVKAFDSLRVTIRTGVKKGWVGKVQQIVPEEKKPIRVSFPDGETKMYTRKQLEVIWKDREKYSVQLERSKTS